jgi:hypothetical protein
MPLERGDHDMNARRFTVTVLAAAMLSLSGCSTSPDIVLGNRSGQTVRCAGYLQGFFINSAAGHRQQRECVEDYQRAGYERVPDTH